MTLSSWTTINAGATTYSYNYTVPWSATATDPCTGEMIDWTGTLHYHGNMVMTPSGNVHVSDHANWVGISGVGQETGTTYHLPGGIHDTFNTNAGSEHTYVRTQSIISQGSGPNYKVKIRHHHTTNANGEVTIWTDFFSFECD